MAQRKQQWLPREGWHYALLLLLLLSTGTLALRSILSYIGNIIPEGDLFPVAAALSFMLLGFMLIAGVFALYAIRFSAHAESLRRVNALVNSMDYIRDPVLVLDRAFVLTGSNPAARKAFQTETLHKRPLSTVLPFLSEESIERLKTSATPSEVEATIPASTETSSHTYRVRAYPSAHITVLLVTDISGLAGLRARQRQNSYLQLIGHIARGVATDFNDLLCGISGHATLMGRQVDEDSPLQSSLQAIMDCTERGIRVGSHLIELASHESYPRSSIAPSEHVEASVRLLRSSLDTATQLTLEIHPPIPILGISGKQLEQAIHSLGLLAVDTLGPHTNLTIQLAPANAGPLSAVPEHASYAAVLFIHAALSADVNDDLNSYTPVPHADAGIVESVVASIVTEIGGSLESYRADQGTILYRVLLPMGMLTASEEEAAFEMPEELAA